MKRLVIAIAAAAGIAFAAAGCSGAPATGGAAARPGLRASCTLGLDVNGQFAPQDQQVWMVFGTWNADAPDPAQPGMDGAWNYQVVSGTLPQIEQQAAYPVSEFAGPLRSQSAAQQAAQTLSQTQGQTGSVPMSNSLPTVVAAVQVTVTNPGRQRVPVGFVAVSLFDGSGNQLGTMQVTVPVQAIGAGNTVTALHDALAEQGTVANSGDNANSQWQPGVTCKAAG